MQEQKFKTVMMTKELYLLMVLLLSFACKNSGTVDSANNVDTCAVEATNLTDTNVDAGHIYSSDSVAIAVKNDSFNFIIGQAIGKQRWKYELAKLNIPTKVLDLVWVNQHYACMLIWYSQAQSRHIFISTKSANKFLYFDKDIEKMDSVNNNIVYIDSIHTDIDKIVFKVENLLSREVKVLEFSIGEQNRVYPYYDEIILTADKLTITTGTGRKSIHINEIY